MQKSILALALLAACAGEAHGATAQITGQLKVTGDLTITIIAPWAFTFSPPAPTVLCTAAPGSLVSTMVPTGGDGTTPSYTLTGGDPANAFAVSGSTLVIGPNGAASLCPTPPALSTQEILAVDGTQN